MSSKADLEKNTTIDEYHSFLRTNREIINNLVSEFQASNPYFDLDNLQTRFQQEFARLFYTIHSSFPSPKEQTQIFHDLFYLYLTAADCCKTKTDLDHLNQVYSTISVFLEATNRDTQLLYTFFAQIINFGLNYPQTILEILPLILQFEVTLNYPLLEIIPIILWFKGHFKFRHYAIKQLQALEKEHFPVYEYLITKYLPKRPLKFQMTILPFWLLPEKENTLFLFGGFIGQGGIFPSLPTVLSYHAKSLQGSEMGLEMVDNFPNVIISTENQYFMINFDSFNINFSKLSPSVLNSAVISEFDNNTSEIIIGRDGKYVFYLQEEEFSSNQKTTKSKKSSKKSSKKKTSKSKKTNKSSSKSFHLCIRNQSETLSSKKTQEIFSNIPEKTQMYVSPPYLLRNHGKTVDIAKYRIKDDKLVVISQSTFQSPVGVINSLVYIDDLLIFTVNSSYFLYFTYLGKTIPKTYSFEHISGGSTSL